MNCKGNVSNGLYISSASDLQNAGSSYHLNHQIKIKRNIVIIEHLGIKIGIKTSFTMSMKIKGYHQ